MEGLREYRLLPVPMRLDDPRWHRSWRQKPCLVYHISESQARSAAARFFTVEGAGVFAGFPWDDPTLVMCEAAKSLPRLRAAAPCSAQPVAERWRERKVDEHLSLAFSQGLARD